MRLIDAEELERLFNAQIEQGATDAFDAFDDALQDALTIDAVPVVHGRWIVRFNGPYKRRRCYCSRCEKHNGVGGIAQNQEKPYCPNCGAKMDGGADDAAD